MSSLMPPTSDELISRHQFYSTVVGQTNINAKDIDGVAKKLGEFTHDFESVRDDVKASNIRSKTLISIGLFLWSVVGGGVGLYVQRGITSFDKASTTVEVLEKKVDTLEKKVEVLEKINEKKYKNE